MRGVGRFWGMVDISPGCWDWIGHRCRDGYGKTKAWRNGKRQSFLSHRLAWEQVNGAIPNGMYVCHRCDNPACVNPDHLFLGSQRQNMADMVSKGRSVHRKGSSNPRAKLTPEQVAIIRQRRSQGELLRELSASFGVATSTVARIAKGTCW